MVTLVTGLNNLPEQFIKAACFRPLFLFLAKKVKEVSRFISDCLKQREAERSLRSLKTETLMVDFCSNDYLGFSRSTELKTLFNLEIQKYPEYHLGSSGSRLLAGNDKFSEDLESDIAEFHNAEASLLFNSGYNANVGIFSSIPQRGDTIICDEYIHASIIDGVRLSHATRYVFKHNDLLSLEEKLKVSRGRIFIAVESIYSMDGDEAPLKDICNLAEKYSAAVIVDEAHAIGVFGNHGKGITNDLDLNSKVFARIITFGKALGVHGAAVLGSSTLRTYLINYARPFIYTTAAPFLSHLAVKVAYDFLKAKDHQSPLHERIQYFRSNMNTDRLVKSRSGIQVLLIPGNEQVKDIAARVQHAGFDVRPILSPTVPKGAERLRICLHNHNSFAQIQDLCQTLNLHCEA